MKQKNNLTEEEKGKYQFPHANYDLLPSQFPKVPSVRDIAIPPQIKMQKLGCIQKIMSDPVPLVIVESLAEVKPLNDESMVFDIDRKPIGLIFETFGPVKQPFYSIRFNDMKEIEDAGLKEEKPIYFAEGFADYIPTTKLLLEKGSDASWENDKEVDPIHMVRHFRQSAVPGVVLLTLV